MEHFEKFIETERIYEGRILNLRKDVVELENGQAATREVVEHNGGVAVLAVDEADNVLFVQQFRYAVGKLLLELPAGKLEKGEDPAVCGKRELEEECGCTCDVYAFLAAMFPTCAYDTEKIHLYFARGLHETTQHLDPGEFLTVERIPFQKAVSMVLNGEIEDGKTQLGILKYKALREAGIAPFAGK